MKLLTKAVYLWSICIKTHKQILLGRYLRSGAVAHIYKPPILGGRRTAWVQELETRLGNIERHSLQKISWVWCHTPLFLATWEAEWEHHLSTGIRGCSAAWVIKSLSLKKKKKVFKISRKRLANSVIKISNFKSYG